MGNPPRNNQGNRRGIIKGRNLRRNPKKHLKKYSSGLPERISVISFEKIRKKKLWMNFGKNQLKKEPKKKTLGEIPVKNY